MSERTAEQSHAPENVRFRDARMLVPLIPALAAILWLSISFRTAMALLLVGHALIHTGYLTPAPEQKAGAPQWPFRLDRSWLLSRLGHGSRIPRLIGTALVAVTLVAGLSGGFGLLTDQAWWGAAAVISAAVSLVLLVLTCIRCWHSGSSSMPSSCRSSCCGGPGWVTSAEPVRLARGGVVDGNAP